MVIEPQRFPWFLDIYLEIAMCYIAVWSSRGVISDSNLNRPRIGWSFQVLCWKTTGFAMGFPQQSKPYHMGVPAQGPRPNRTPWWRGARLGYTAVIGVYRISPHFFTWGKWRQVGCSLFLQKSELYPVATTFISWRSPKELWDHPWLGQSCNTSSQFKPVFLFL